MNAIDYDIRHLMNFLRKYDDVNGIFIKVGEQKWTTGPENE